MNWLLVLFIAGVIIEGAGFILSFQLNGNIDFFSFLYKTISSPMVIVGSAFCVPYFFQVIRSDYFLSGQA